VTTFLHISYFEALFYLALFYFICFVFLSAPAAAAGVSGDDDQASFQKIVQASSIPGFTFKNFIAIVENHDRDQFFKDAGIRGQEKYDLIAIRDRARAAQQGKNKSLVYFDYSFRFGHLSYLIFISSSFFVCFLPSYFLSFLSFPPFLVISYIGSQLSFYFFVFSSFYYSKPGAAQGIKQNFERLLPLKILIILQLDLLPKFIDSLHFETFFFLKLRFLFVFSSLFFVKCIDVLKSSCSSR
jgi:hypothetical protein